MKPVYLLLDGTPSVTYILSEDEDSVVIANSPTGDSGSTTVPTETWNSFEKFELVSELYNAIIEQLIESKIIAYEEIDSIYEFIRQADELIQEATVEYEKALDSERE